MNKVIPITNEQLIRFAKNFYKIDGVSFCYVEDIYINWEHFEDITCGFSFLDTAIENELIKDIRRNILEKVIYNVLGI